MLFWLFFFVFSSYISLLLIWAKLDVRLDPTKTYSGVGCPSFPFHSCSGIEPTKNIYCPGQSVKQLTLRQSTVRQTNSYSSTRTHTHTHTHAHTHTHSHTHLCPIFSYSQLVRPGAHRTALPPTHALESVWWPPHHLCLISSPHWPVTWAERHQRERLQRAGADQPHGCGKLEGGVCNLVKAYETDVHLCVYGCDTLEQINLTGAEN